MRRVFVLAVFFFAFFSFSPLILAKDYSGFGPFELRVQNPLYLQSLSLKPRRAKTLDVGVLELRADYAHSNLFENEQQGNNIVNLDMELIRTSLHAHYAWFENFELGIEIPFYHFGGGFLDSFIDSYHTSFGFPRGGRNLVANDTFAYQVQKNGRLLIDTSSESFGLGDITLHSKHQVLDQSSKPINLAWFFDLKLPTGDRGEGLGSGNLGFGLGLA